MLNQEDLKWIARICTDLNSTLQQISRYSDLARQHKGEHNYLEMLGERVDLASKQSQALFDRVTTKILSVTTGEDKNVRMMPPPKGARAVTHARPAEPANGSKIPADISVKNPKGGRELVMIVEDEPDVADIAGEMLAEEGYRVIVAHDGMEALRIYQQISRQIGLVILDFFLPVMDGDAVFDELRALNPKVNVVLSSGFAEQTKLSQMLSRGLRGFIPKPYTRQKLLDQVRTTLDAARQGH